MLYIRGQAELLHHAIHSAVVAAIAAAACCAAPYCLRRLVGLQEAVHARRRAAAARGVVRVEQRVDEHVHAAAQRVVQRDVRPQQHRLARARLPANRDVVVARLVLEGRPEEGLAAPSEQQQVRDRAAEILALPGPMGTKYDFFNGRAGF